jgi:hypothetical protein
MDTMFVSFAVAAIREESVEIALRIMQSCDWLTD